MRRVFASLIAVLVTCGASWGQSYPTPSPYPIAWELDFRHAHPKRIVVNVTDEGPVAFYYMTYTVTNKTGRERVFYPNFQLLTQDGQLIRSDRSIPPHVFDAIKRRERNQFLERPTDIAGEILLGEDQARDSVAVWREPSARMGRFSIFVHNLSGEHATLKDADGEVRKDKDGNPIILRKTLQLNYHIRGDEVYPGEDEINKDTERWIMR